MHYPLKPCNNSTLTASLNMHTNCNNLHCNHALSVWILISKSARPRESHSSRKKNPASISLREHPTINARDTLAFLSRPGIILSPCITAASCYGEDLCSDRVHSSCATLCQMHVLSVRALRDRLCKGCSCSQAIFRVRLKLKGYLLS